MHSARAKTNGLEKYSSTVSSRLDVPEDCDIYVEAIQSSLRYRRGQIDACGRFFAWTRRERERTARASLPSNAKANHAANDNGDPQLVPSRISDEFMRRSLWSASPTPDGKIKNGDFVSISTIAAVDDPACRSLAFLRDDRCKAYARDRCRTQYDRAFNCRRRFRWNRKEPMRGSFQALRYDVKVTETSRRPSHDLFDGAFEMRPELTTSAPRDRAPTAFNPSLRALRSTGPQRWKASRPVFSSSSPAPG